MGLTRLSVALAWTPSVLVIWVRNASLVPSYEPWGLTKARATASFSGSIIPEEGFARIAAHQGLRGLKCRYVQSRKVYFRRLEKSLAVFMYNTECVDAWPSSPVIARRCEFQQ